MSESILKALMQLFAIIARPDSNENSRRPLVIDFLKQQLNLDLVHEYLLIFDNYYQKHKKRQTHRSRKGLASSSVRVLTICTVINKELTLKQKIIVVIRLLEFINSERNPNRQELEFVETVAETFHISIKEFEEFKTLVFDTYNNIPDFDNILIISNINNDVKKNVKHLYAASVDGPIIVYHCRSANMHAFVYHGNRELYLNGQMIHKDRVYVLSSGSAIRDAKRHPVYYSDIVSAYNIDDDSLQVAFEAKNITYKFKNSILGVQETNFVEKSGKLIGIMGGSGSGKSTLLSVLNGSFKPETGSVKINGFDVHTDKDRIEGVIGHVSQDDLLMEDLTVFQNLYYNAKLCFSKYNKRKLLRIVVTVLKSIGLYEIKAMKVGSPLNKKISGGQRKRLNIALELIREPTVLFLDEPTSGLSSRDSENIMDILKELTLKGKLIFVVIHQPSSDIFKMFDRLMIIDQGGYTVYDGDPVDAIVYFKSGIKQADWSASECPDCGNVNPEQIFDIIESQVLDEYGNITSTRKTLPKEWHSYYKKNKKENNNGLIENAGEIKKLPKISFKIPGRVKQFYIFVQREVLSKLSNRQYLIMNIFEAPVLAFLLSYIIKYYNIANSDVGYILSKNTNLPVYIFMAVIVGLFVGMTLSADEIIKDRKILKRESFLNLSRTSYLFSKIFILFAISAYQALVFVLIGNSILEIKNMYLEYWIVLFSSWTFSVLMGLNISDGFKTTITIYIVIPFLIIPQIILSGIIVRYEKLNPSISSPGKIPWFGEIITARWAYEALAVNQFVENKYMKPIYKYERGKHHANYKKDKWLKDLELKLNYYNRNKDNDAKKDETKKYLRVIKNEIKKELIYNKKVRSNLKIENLEPNKVKDTDLLKVDKYFKDLNNYYKHLFKIYDEKEEEYVYKQTKNDSLNVNYIKLKRQNHNITLEDFVTNEGEIEPIVEYEDELYQKTGMIYQYPKSFVKAHFYAPKKLFFGNYYSTLYVNLIIIWLYNIILYFMLYYSFIKRSLNFLDRFSSLYKKGNSDK